MNARTWQGLSAQQQQWMNDEARRLEIASVKRFDELAAAEEVEMRRLGMQETRFPAPDASRLEDLWAQGVWEIARAKNGADADRMRQLAVARGLSK